MRKRHNTNGISNHKANNSQDFGKNFNQMMSTISNSSQLNKVQSNFRGDNMVSSILNSNNKQILTIKTNVK